jgi:peptidoglycan/LPS O-acetylase OafA/YrhL
LTINSRDRIPSLDGLRGIAILLVFLFHYFPRDHRDPLSALASLGWSGVDLFFVLSGFLITGILTDTRDAPNRFKAFYLRRILRLFPVYFVAVSIVVVGTHFLRGYRNWMDIPFFFYGSNIVELLPHSVSIFPPYFNCQHFWSLALEEQFYSIWPFVVFFVPSRRTLIRVCVCGILGALTLRVIATALGLPLFVSYIELPARMDSLLIGALLAILVREPDPARWLNKKRLNWVFWGGERRARHRARHRADALDICPDEHRGILDSGEHLCSGCCARPHPWHVLESRGVNARFTFLWEI